MSPLALIPVFVTGLLGSVHCIGMCGGIVVALSAPPVRTFPVPVLSRFNAPRHVLAYNCGRIISYSVAGSIAGGLAQGAAGIAHIASLQLAMYWVLNLTLLALGLYFMNLWQGITRLEAVGALLWRKLQPVRARLAPARTPLQAFSMGLLWGWVPCAMVYSVLLTALMSGTALDGAMLMFAFGLGTLPMLLVVGVFGAGAAAYLTHPRVRFMAGSIVLGFAVLGLTRAAMGMQLGWIDALCLAPGRQQ